jgi:hypothetical protein
VLQHSCSPQVDDDFFCCTASVETFITCNFFYLLKLLSNVLPPQSVFKTFVALTFPGCTKTSYSLQSFHSWNSCLFFRYNLFLHVDSFVEPILELAHADCP